MCPRVRTHKVVDAARRVVIRVPRWWRCGDERRILSERAAVFATDAAAADGHAWQAKPRVGTVSIDGTKIDANASKIRSVRYDRARELRAKVAADITALTARAEAADAEADDPQALPVEIARRATLKAKLDAACARLEAQARAGADAARPAYEVTSAAPPVSTTRPRTRSGSCWRACASIRACRSPARSPPTRSTGSSASPARRP